VRVATNNGTDLHQAFRAWLDEARPRLAVGINIQSSTADVTEFSFDVANPVLTGALTARGDLTVSAEWKGDCWDFLLSEEARPKQTPAGIVCSICESEGKHRVFASVDALCHDHLFDPFETWINTKLAVAQSVALYRASDGGSTWARLLQDGDQVGTPTFLVSLT
jgi:hypothetical protein